ncbi:MAG: glycogen/starch/alpha-glucan phosphorylase [Eubacterium ventriosum]
MRNGYQKEIPEDWLRHANPLEIKREEYACEVKFGGYVRVENRDGRNYFIQEGYQSVYVLFHMICQSLVIGTM